MLADQQPRWNKYIRLIGTLISLVLLGYFFYRVGMKDFLTAIQKISMSGILFAILLTFISRLATFLRWHVLLQGGDTSVSWKDSLRLTFAGLFAANFLPTTIGGDVLRLAGALRLGIDAARAAASLVADRLVGMAGMALVAPLGLAPLVAKITAKTTLFPLVVAALTGQKKSFTEKIKLWIEKLISSFRFWYHNPGKVMMALFFTFIHMACIFGIIQILSGEMGESLSFWKIAGLWSLTYFITLLPVSINGLGLQEVSFVNLFGLLGGLSTGSGLSIALIMRGLMLIGSIPGAFFVSDLLQGKKSNGAPAGGEVEGHEGQ